MLIPINKIVPNPEQPRKEFDPGELSMLADSIRQHGVINPIAVEAAGDQYILIDGERRVRAARIAGLKEIEASVRPSSNGTGHKDRLTLALVANLQRSDMNPIEEANAYFELKSLGYSIPEIGELVGLAKSNVYMRLQMLDLEPEIQELFAARQLPLHTTVVKAIKEVSEENRVRVARSLAQKKATVATILTVCKRTETRQYHKSTPTRQTGEQWNMLKQLNNDPRLRRYEAAALATCKMCAIYDVASPSSCRDCPAVDLLKHLIEVTHER